MELNQPANHTANRVVFMGGGDHKWKPLINKFMEM